MNSIISLSGYSRSGKDTLAGFITHSGRHHRVAFADALKQTLYETNPLLDTDGTRLQDAIDTYGPEGIKETHYYKEYRRLCQDFGTEGARNNISETVWIDIVLAKVTRETERGFVVTDTRFLNELTALKDAGAVTVWVERPGVGPVNGHISDNQIGPADCDFTVVNDGDPGDMFGEFLNNYQKHGILS